MKKIGLVGGISWVSTIDYYRYLNEGINEKLGGLNFAECMLYSLNFGDIHAKTWYKSFDLLLNACKNLQNSGADAIVLCANTAHLFAEELQNALSIPIIHIVEETAKTIQQQGLKKIGLLGTQFTMEMDFFKNGLKKHGIEPLIPALQKDRDFIQHTLKEELGRGIIKAETKQEYLKIITQLIQDGAEGIILGCTEIPLLLSQQDCSVPVFDTTKIHAQAAVAFALSESDASLEPDASLKLASGSKPIINTNELLELAVSENVVIVDVSNHPMAKTNYLQKHLKGAFFVDINTQLADIQEDVSIGGRHPLPSFLKFSTTLESLGIDRNSHVIVYDDKNGGNAAARFWWMLTAIGHPKVQVLNGGFQAAEKAGFPTLSGLETPKKQSSYPIEKWILPLTDLKKVEEVAQNDDFIVIDVREAARYNGETEPIDLVAGHIPGAINVPFASNLEDNGLFKSPAELKAKYELIFAEKPSENIIVHCGSGVTACHTLLAIAHAGLEIPNLYVGSWSEWSRNDKPIGTKFK